jgi:outer membrane receptor protein involved in Fe transport
MRKHLILIILGFMLLPLCLEAGIYGTLKGKVVDGDGNPVQGASIRIEGTTKGAYSKNDGKFTITGINSGEYSVKITFVGKKTTFVKKVLISADKTNSLGSLELQEEGDDGGPRTKEVVKYADRIMVDNGQMGTDQTQTRAEMESTVGSSIAATVALSAGVLNSGTGFSIRGARSGETQIRVDGLDVGNQFTGGAGVFGTSNMPMVSQYGTQEVQVLSGTFSAEYGEALGGVVNTIVRTGSIDRYEGTMVYGSNLTALNGSSDSHIDLRYEGQQWVPYEVGDGYKRLGPDRNEFDFNIGGPLPGLKNSTFFISSNFKNDAASGGYDIYDPDGNSLTQMPDYLLQKKNITGRLKFNVSDEIKLIVGGQWGMTNYAASSWGWLYADTEGKVLNGNMNPSDEAIANAPSNGVSTRVAQQNVYETVIGSMMARITHQLSDESFYELTVSNNINNDEISKRKNYDDPSFFTGYDMWYPQDEWEINSSETGLDKVEGFYGDRIIDEYTVISRNIIVDDGHFTRASSSINPLTGYIEGQADASPTSNPYGLYNMFNTYGNTRSFSFRNGNYFQVDGNYTLNTKTGDYDHNFKTGFEVRMFTMKRHSNSLPWDGNPFFDVATDEWGGNFYTDDPDARVATSKGFNPIKISAFVQDQITYKQIIISPGLRFDMFMPESQYRTGTDFVPVGGTVGFDEATTKFQVSPRINVAYPITERSNISIAYGLYFQTPGLQYLYDNFNAEQIRGGVVLGNPEMKPQRTNQYEVSFNQEISDLFAFHITTYYRDIYNQLGVVTIETRPDPYDLRQTVEFGTSRGIELRLRKRLSPDDNIGFSLNYTYSSTRGTASGPGGLDLGYDPYSEKKMFPLNEYTLSNDIPHRINFILNFAWFKDQGPSIAGVKPLENFQLGFTTVFSSGSPYTSYTLDAEQKSDINGARQPSIWNTNLRISKMFELSDWFGEGMGRSSLTVFMDIYNLLNLTYAVALNSRTADPIDNGVTFYRQKGDITGPNPWYKDGDFLNGASYRSDQYDNFGTRLYSSQADTDGNNKVTDDERYQAYFDYVETAINFRGNFKAPRSVYWGIKLEF